jgi:KaiC/GvpD/RAD55 family RecA-like ATPase
MTESDLIQTGIYGLDQIFLGGILKGNLILVEGAAGTGKTLLGVEFIYRGITEQDEPGIIVVFETSPRKLIRDATGFGWNLDELQQRNKLTIIFTSPQVLDQELRSPDSLLVRRESSGIHLMVEDNGRGFDNDALLQAPGTGKGLGLLDIRERAALLNGPVTLESRPGSGTTVHVCIPLREENHG